MIRTFWMGLLYFIIACALCALLIGFALLPFVLLWFVVRCAVGLMRLFRTEAIPVPETWTIWGTGRNPGTGQAATISRRTMSA